MGFFAYQAELGRDSARRAGGEVAVQRCAGSSGSRR